MKRRNFGCGTLLAWGIPLGIIFLLGSAGGQVPEAGLLFAGLALVIAVIAVFIFDF